MFIRKQYLSIKQKTEDIFVALTDNSTNPSSVITMMIYLARYIVCACAQTCTYKESNTEEPAGEQQKVVR